jgi:hypothetical protein
MGAQPPELCNPWLARAFNTQDVDGKFAMTRSQWLIKGTDKNGQATEVHHNAWTSTAVCLTEAGCSSTIIPLEPIQAGPSKHPRRPNGGVVSGLP